MEVSGQVIDFERARIHFDRAQACENAAPNYDGYTSAVLMRFARTLRERGRGSGRAADAGAALPSHHGAPRGAGRRA